jgi:hypothetical protein
VLLVAGSGAVRGWAALAALLVPLAAISLLLRQPLLYGIVKPKRDPRTDPSVALLAGGLGLLLLGADLEFVSTTRLALFAVPIAAAVAGALSASARRSPYKLGAWIVVLMIGALYGYGATVAADTLLDHGKPSLYRAAIEGKHQTQGRSTTYYLDLAPWGPVPGSNRLSVRRSLYDEAQPGDQVCLELHPGYLRTAWYRLIDCEPSIPAQ